MSRPMPRRRVLLVDDEELIREVATVSLAKVGGWEVLTASSGEEGLGKAAAEQPDAILLDVMMPGMNGLEVARHLRDDPETSDIPIIVVSAKAQESDLNAGRTAGVDDYVTKPFDPFELLERVARLLADGSQRPYGSPGEG